MIGGGVAAYGQTLTAGFTYPITVGAGGAAGSSGGDSSFQSFVGHGGGGGGGSGQGGMYGGRIFVLHCLL
jgi:fibronectin-binding autotransporter adhesin